MYKVFQALSKLRDTLTFYDESFKGYDKPSFHLKLKTLGLVRHDRVFAESRKSLNP